MSELIKSLYLQYYTKFNLLMIGPVADHNLNSIRRRDPCRAAVDKWVVDKISYKEERKTAYILAVQWVRQG